MTGKFYQCCYTNASRTDDDGRVSSGWQAVCVSPDIPPDAFQACVALLGANSSIQSGMVDERGNILNQLQLAADSSYLFLTRTQYGLLDRVGRPNMFAHAYIFPLRDGAALTDPNEFLSVGRENFRDSEQAAGQIPVELARTDPWSTGRALQATGMDAERYRALIRCVYLQMTERKAKKPLYVQYDGTDSGLAALLYCIWRGIPFSLRRQLRAAAPAAGDVSTCNLVFTEFAERHDYRINPQTGENTVLTPRARRRVERLGFVDYAPAHSRDGEAESFFAALEERAVQLGDPAASGELVLKIACQMLGEDPADRLDAAELDSRISDAMRTRNTGSALMAGYIAGLLREVVRRRVFLSDESEQNLSDWLGHCASTELAQAGEQYSIYRLGALTVPEAVEKLARMPLPVFHTVSRKLLGEPQGPEILDRYHSAVPFRAQPGWEALQQVLRDSDYLPARPATERVVREYAWQLYCNDLESGADAVDAHRQYAAVIQALGDDRERAEREARNRYWEQIQFADLSPAAVEEYQYFSVGDNDTCRIFSELLNIGYLLDESGERAFLLGLHAFCSRYLQGLGEQPIRAAVAGLLRAPGREGEDLARWAELLVADIPHDLAAALLDVRQLVQSDRFDLFLDSYRTVRDLATEHDMQEFSRQAADRLLDSCLAQDSADTPVPLDTWLAIGSVRCKNPFGVFDRVSPAILAREPADVVAGSELLQKPAFLSAGERYAHEKSEHAKAVRRWLAEWRHAEKRRSADEKRGSRPESGGLGGLLNKGLSLLGRPGRDSDSPARQAPADAPDTPADDRAAESPDPDADKWPGYFGDK